MKRFYFLFVLIIPVMCKGQDAAGIVKKMVQAYGGAAWDTVNYIRMHHIGHQHWLEQSENPQGPFITSYLDTDEIRSSRERKLYFKTESKMLLSPEPGTSTQIQVDTVGLTVFGERKMPLYYSMREENLKWIQYGPEHLVAQMQKSNVKLDKQIMLDGVNHYQLSFIHEGMGHRIFINASTFLISEAHIDTYSPYEFYFSLWGKFTTRIQYTIYSLHRHNIVYPLQWDISRIGQPWKRITINKIEFLKNIDESIFEIPEEVRKRQMPNQHVNTTTLPVEKAVEVAKGIFTIPGYWYTGWAEQEDGIVVIDAPISPGYSVQLISEIKKRYPAKKVKGVVISSDAWPHLAGVREYFSANVPVYTNVLNKPILDRIAVADYTPMPDHQQVAKATPVYKLVDKSMLLDDKTVPIQIIPIQGEGGERMVAVYYPKQKVLYASDLIQRQSGGFFFIEYIAEVKALVDRHKLDVEKVYAMHASPLAWTEIVNALNKNK